jgi:hypothetical protein
MQLKVTAAVAESVGDHHPRMHHTHDASDSRRRLGLVLLLTAVCMLAEACGGWLTGSLTLLADAAHMLTDVAALTLALMAAWFSTRPATSTKTFGYHRLEILAALVNGVALVVISLRSLRSISTLGHTAHGARQPGDFRHGRSDHQSAAARILHGQHGWISTFVGPGCTSSGMTGSGRRLSPEQPS